MVIISYFESSLSRAQVHFFTIIIIIIIIIIIRSIILHWLISRVFANGPGDWDSFPGWVILKTQKMVLDATLLNTQHYKVKIKSKVGKSREWSSALPYTSV